MIDAPPQVKTAVGPDMQNHAENSLASDYAAALDWWRDAGVDCDFEAIPQNWLEDPEEKRKPPPPDVASAKPADPEREPAITPAMLPDDLAAFQKWWTAADTPFPCPEKPRVAPRGDVGANLMVIAPMPEGNDRDTLLAGPQGKLVANIARALSIPPDTLYWASALPANMPLPDWDSLKAEGLGMAVARHVALVKPERLLVFGSKLPMLLGHDSDAPPDQFTSFEGANTLTTFAPERLLDHPRQLARLWNRLLQWTA